MSANVVRYSAKQSIGFVDAISDLVRHRDLLLLLVQKELKLKYKGTVLGVFWSLLNPLLLMAVYAIVFSVVVRYPVRNFPIFLLSGLLPWTAFSTTLATASTCIINNSNLVRRIRFPVEMLPVTVVIANLVNMALGFLLLIGFVIGYHQAVGLSLLSLPVLVLLQLMFSLGVAMALSALTVYFRDLVHLVSIGVMVWFFATPVLYPLSIFQGKQVYSVLRLNPMAWLMDGYQRVWHAAAWPDGGYTLAFAAVSVLALVLGWWIFHASARRFAEEV
jgi:ABC-type polysaccharide/polyol phosphate export permease